MAVNRRELLFATFVLYSLMAFSSLLVSYLYQITTPKPGYPKYRASSKPLEQFEMIQAEYAERLAAVPKPKYNDSACDVGMGETAGNNGNYNRNRQTSKKSKLILLWNTFKKAKHSCVDKATGNRCFFTEKKAYALVADAIVFNSRYLPVNLPSVRLSNQRYVYFCREPPHIVGKHVVFERYNGVFNWTITYRVDSDFPAPYVKTGSRRDYLPDDQYRLEISDVMARKTKLVAAMTSNCTPRSPRIDYISKLRRYLPIDFYGECGNLSCARHTEECTSLMSSYKFFLSFENSQCRDYITEKVNKPLYKWKAVPIVLGALSEEYDRVMPPFSYIHTDGFSSVKELSDYIKLLDGNPDLYLRYHAWRRTHTDNLRASYWCDMCFALHDTSLPTKTYRDFSGWYNQDHPTCLSPQT